MIDKFSDHAANERTFLAWVRTAIAVMAFGFLVEKFDLFLEVASQSLAAKAISARGQLIGNVAGLLLIILGGVMLCISVIRFRQTSIDIDARDARPVRGGRMDVVLVALLGVLGLILFAYLSYTSIARL